MDFFPGPGECSPQPASQNTMCFGQGNDTAIITGAKRAAWDVRATGAGSGGPSSGCGDDGALGRHRRADPMGGGGGAVGSGRSGRPAPTRESGSALAGSRGRCGSGGGWHQQRGIGTSTRPRGCSLSEKMGILVNRWRFLTIQKTENRKQSGAHVQSSEQLKRPFRGFHTSFGDLRHSVTFAYPTPPPPGPPSHATLCALRSARHQGWPKSGGNGGQRGGRRLQWL